MLSAVLLVILGVVFAVVRSYRKNRRLVAEGGRAYRPAPGLIGWDAATAPSSPGSPSGGGAEAAER